ncbi:putative protein heading date repressor 1 [Helianthus annuus]|nr:putative protein heading date repressor 1 [Helianthus annuus]
MEEDNKVVVNGFSPVTSTPVFWKSRKRSASMKNLNKDNKDEADKTTEEEEEKVRDDASCSFRETYPRGWLIGKKRKLVNVDVVESMRRIAVQEMNRKDGLNEQLEEDSRVLEHLQLQLLDERSKRADVERQNALLQNQVDMLMNMLQEPENIEEDELPQDP